MTIATLIEALSFPFFQRALIITPIIAGIYGIIGTLTVIRKETIISHSIAHFAFLGVTIALLLNIAPTTFVIPFSILAAIIIWYLQKNPQFTKDSILTLSAHAALAFSLIIASFQDGYRTELTQFLFGNILALTNTDIAITLIIAAIVITTLTFFFRPILQTILSPSLARSNKINPNPNLYNLLYLVVISIAIAAGIKILGLLLLEAFLVFPANIAKLHTNSLKGLLISSTVISISTTVIGLFLAYILNLPASATIVILFTLMVVVGLIGTKLYKK